LNFIQEMVQKLKVNTLIYENTNFINSRNRDSLNLIRLLGSLECLPIKQATSVNVLKVKEMTKLLLAGKIKIANLDYQVGRSKG
jgi:hypothetical protein